jgi:hypothetical protein
MAGYSVEDQVTALEALAAGRKLRRIVWTNVAVRLALLFLLLITLVVIPLAFLSAWQTGDWQNLDDNLLGAEFPFVFLFLLPALPARRRNALPAVDALRRAASERRDNTLTPVAQSAEPDSTDLPTGSARFDQIGALSNRQAAARLDRLFSIWPVILPILFLFNLYNGISRESVLPIGTYLPDPKMVDTGEIVLGAVVVGMAGLLLIRARVYRRGVPVTADAWGIQWHPRRHRTVSLAWHDVRSFFTFSYGSAIGSGSAGVKTLVYVVDAGDALLVCQCYPALSSVSAAVRQRKEVDRFVKLVVARTGKPLRDLSSYTRRLAERPGAITHHGMLPQATEYQQYATPLSGKAAARQTRVYVARGCAIVLALLLLPILVVGGSFTAKAQLHDYQASYYASLPARLHGHEPLYFSDLTSADDHWFNQDPTSDNPFGYVFADDGYHLTGMKNFVSDSWLHTTYVDSAVEVTASQTAGQTNDGVGLILRSDIMNSNMVVFFASPTDGSWRLYAFHFGHANPDDNWTYLTGGTSAAIRIGVIQPNRLLAIMRGGQYLLYINNQFVGSYYDNYHDTPRRGYVGVYVNQVSTEGIFTNFSVYQVKPPPSLEYV